MKIVCFKLFLLVLATITVLVLSGCQSHQVDYSSEVQLAQKDVPFKIVVPHYLPSTMHNYPINISPPDVNQVSGATNIAFRIGRKGSRSFIYCLEENVFAGYDTFFGNNLNIGGIKVTEEYNSSPNVFLADEKGIPDVDILEYCWNQDDISIELIIGGNDIEECRKIVESMIKMQ